jgi:hypothetical protein
MEDWRRYYNEERPHGAIGQKPPIMLLNRDGAASPPSSISRKTPASGDPKNGLSAGETGACSSGGAKNEAWLLYKLPQKGCVAFLQMRLLVGREPAPSEGAWGHPLLPPSRRARIPDGRREGQGSVVRDPAHDWRRGGPQESRDE